jgi:hypothetical protein
LPTPWCARAGNPRAALPTLCNASYQPGSLAAHFIASMQQAICSSTSAPREGANLK